MGRGKVLLHWQRIGAQDRTGILPTRQFVVKQEWRWKLLCYRNAVCITQEGLNNAMHEDDETPTSNCTLAA